MSQNNLLCSEFQSLRVNKSEYFSKTLSLVLNQPWLYPQIWTHTVC